VQVSLGVISKMYDPQGVYLKFRIRHFVQNKSLLYETTTELSTDYVAMLFQLRSVE